jgi:c-di-GMP-related signal transduction protein
MKTTSATPAPEQVPAPSQQLRYVARQPIFDRETKVFGYELLFRDGVENAFVGGDADMASRATLDRSVLVGLDMLCDGKRAFVNCTRDTLIKGLVTLLPPTSTVVEILESVTPDPDVMAAVERLKEAGYMIALDDFVTGDLREPLAELADIIKVELKLTTAAQQSAMVKRYGPWKRRMLAEKVETQEEFTAAKEMGFVYFQG